jgi:predicted Ser/Thr protein kinase
MAIADSRLLAGRYQLGKLLGKGGMGRVWLARDVVLDRDVAIKEITLPADLAAQEHDALRRRTLREARAAARLTHPNVAQVYDVLEVAGRPWIVMEYVRSRSLQQVLDTDGAFEPRRVAEIGLEVLAALQAAHRVGVRHRDVKPSNILLADDGRVVLTDFGIASIEGDGITTSSDLVLGSPQFMAPERALRGESSLSSDLWSLGATLYAAVEGRPPYQRPTTVGTLMALAAEEPEPPRRAGALRPVLDGLLRKNPDERADADETRRRLRKAAGLKDPAEEDLRWNRPSGLASAEPASAGAAIAAPGPSRPPPDAAPVDVTVRGSAAAPARAPAETESTRPAVRPAPAAGKGGRSRLRIVVLTLIVVALAGGVAVVMSVMNRSGTGSARSSPGAAGPAVNPSSPKPSAGGSNGPSAGAPPGGTSSGSGSAGTASSGPSTGGGSGRRPALPSGWTDYRDRTGFSVYVPKGWSKSQDGSIVYFRGAGRVLGIDQTTRPNMNPVADWRGKASYRVTHGDFPGYREIHIRSVDYFEKAADWEFTFAGSTTRQHVNNRGLVVNSHQAYGIYWQTPDSQWQDAYPDLQLIFSSFRPRS